jgi:hypothetical protein
MPKAAKENTRAKRKENARAKRSVFGYGYNSSSKRAVGAPSKEPAQLEAAADLAKRYGLSDCEMLLHELNCLAGQWRTASTMYELDDKKGLEARRLKIQSAVSRLIRALEGDNVLLHRLEARVQSDEGLIPGLTEGILHSLQRASARALDDGSPPVFPSRRSDGDGRRGWLVSRLAYLYQTQTRQVARAYVDDGQRTGNSGLHFIIKTFSMLTGNEIPRTAVVRLLHDQRKRPPRPELLV